MDGVLQSGASLNPLEGLMNLSGACVLNAVLFRKILLLVG